MRFLIEELSGVKKIQMDRYYHKALEVYLSMSDMEILGDMEKINSRDVKEDKSSAEEREEKKKKTRISSDADSILASLFHDSKIIELRLSAITKNYLKDSSILAICKIKDLAKYELLELIGTLDFKNIGVQTDIVGGPIDRLKEDIQSEKFVNMTGFINGSGQKVRDVLIAIEPCIDIWNKIINIMNMAGLKNEPIVL